jgi:hypothetical protein
MALPFRCIRIVLARWRRNKQSEKGLSSFELGRGTFLRQALEDLPWMRVWLLLKSSHFRLDEKTVGLKRNFHSADSVQEAVRGIQNWCAGMCIWTDNQKYIDER